MFFCFLLTNLRDLPGRIGLLEKHRAHIEQAAVIVVDPCIRSCGSGQAAEDPGGQLIVLSGRESADSFVRKGIS